MRNFRNISLKLFNSCRNPKPKFIGFIQSRETFDHVRHFNSPAPPPPEKISKIADEISSLTLLEVADLSNLLGNKLQMKDMPMVFPMMPGMGFSLPGMGGAGGGAAAPAAEEKKEEKTAFDLKLEAGFDAAAKIKVIKEVRSFTDLGLKEAKELVEKAPAVLKQGVTKEEAEKIIEKMKAIGAKVVME